MRTSSIIVLTALITVFGGCSGNRDPIALFDQYRFDINDTVSFPVGVTERFPDGSPAGGMSALGLFNLSIDPLNASADLVSLRQTALTDVLEIVDITNFLQMAPCTDCAKIKSVALDPDGNIVVTIGIKHPFEAGNPFKPITGRNRADLHVFNVEGTIVSNLDCTTFNSELKTANFKLMNADGYSCYLDESLDSIYPTEATIHPYILHFDDYSQGNFSPSNSMGFESVTDPPPSGNLVMPMGSDYDYKDYVFDLERLTPVRLDFIYAIGCTYGVSASNRNDRFEPEYRIPQHNKKAASEVSLEIISNNLVAGDPSSTAEIEIHVVDTSQGITVGDALNQMLVDSSVELIDVYVPGIESGSISVDVSSPTGTGHDPSDPLIFPAIITNSANGDAGTYPGLVKVVDSYPPGLNESPLLKGMDGIKRVDPLENPLTGLFDVPEFCTYQVFDIDVFAGGLVCSLVIDPSSPSMPFEGWDCFVFDASGSYDPDGDPLTFEWDFNNDGLFGDSYNAGTPDKPIKVFDFTNKEQVCVIVSDGHGNQEECCIDVDIVGYQSKNIPLQGGVEARDIGVDLTNGDLLVLYADSTVFRYPRVTWYQTSLQIAVMALPNSKVNFIDVAPNGYFYVVGTYTDSDNSVIYFFNPDGTPVSPWPWWGISPDMPSYDVVAMSSGSYQNDACWGFGRFFNSQTGQETHVLRFRYLEWLGFYDHVYYLMGSDYTGYDKLYYEYIKGCESDKNGNFIWFLEDPDYYASRWLLSNSGYLSYLTYDNAYFGTGSQTNDDNGWYDGKDITRDNQNRYFVLDELSTGDPRVKVWTVSGDITTSIGGFGNSSTISEIPRRIEGSDFEGNIVVLHGNSATDGYKISVFLPCEEP